MTELVSRDKNRPSVIAWSVANEPKSDTDYAADYFQYGFCNFVTFAIVLSSCPSFEK